MEQEKRDHTYVEMTPEIKHCACDCSSKKNTYLLYFTLFIAVTSLCGCAYLNWRFMHEQRQSCELSEEDTELLFKKLQSPEAKQLTEKVNMVSTHYKSSLQELPKILYRVTRQVAETNKRPKKQRKHRKRCPRHCRRKGRKGPAGPRGPPGPVGPRGLPGLAAKVMKNKQSIKAAHFMPEFWKDRKDLESNSRLMCINVDKWGGRACRNRTLEMTSGTINFFHPAKWIEENDHISSPVELRENGEFEVKEEGLYLLYSSVTFYDSKMKESQALTVNGTRLFKCMEGVDYVDFNEGRIFNSKYRTCSITGVTYLKKGHRVGVVNLYNKTVIDLTEDATFFGLVQLVPGGKSDTPADGKGNGSGTANKQRR